MEKADAIAEEVTSGGSAGWGSPRTRSCRGRVDVFARCSHFGQGWGEAPNGLLAVVAAAHAGTPACGGEPVIKFIKFERH